VIYFIQDSIQKFVKIGKTRLDLKVRMSAMQTGNPNPLICLRVIESEDNDVVYHKLFEKHRHSREWFRPEPELMQFIESLPETSHTGYVVPFIVTDDRSEFMKREWAQRRADNEGKPLQRRTQWSTIVTPKVLHEIHC
jgi:hypothetical protein